MAVISYNDHLRKLLNKIPCILAFDTAADYLGLTNGGYREKAQIFVMEKQPTVNTEQTKISSFSEKDFQNTHGLLCTTVNQTIVDLLDRNGDEQIITESLANYYDEHGQSFDGLDIPEYLHDRFKKYSQWAMEYYEE